MAKLLNTTFLVTQSAPATPSTGLGTMFASGSKLFFKNSIGQTYDLTLSGSGASGLINVLTYTSSANYTPTTGTQYIKVLCAGAGGGGGSGRVAPPGSTTVGGQGGAGGDISIMYFSSASLTGTVYSVNVGVSGPGGARRTSNITVAGLVGTAGLSSSFGTGSGANFVRLVSALGGYGGIGGGGTANAKVAPTTAVTTNPYPPFYFSGVDGAIDAGAGFGNAATSFASRGLPGGGSGGRIFASNTPTNGGSGSATYLYTTLIQSGSPSTSGSALSGSNGAPVFDIINMLYYSGSNITTGVYTGTGGHGGGSGTRVAPVVSAGGGGSAAGVKGGGGGGGGGAATGSNVIFSGAGGAGGDGFVIIIEYF